MIGWLRNTFQRASSRTPPPTLPEDLWQATLATFPFLDGLAPDAKSRLRELSAAFLRDKEFHGADGMQVTDAMALAVAAQACLPLVYLAPVGRLRDALRWYDDFVGIVLHPGEVLARREVTDDDGVVHHYREALTGEAMDGGPVMLSWSDVAAADETAEHGYNVVIHEFAHKIDLKNGDIDGCPPLPPGFLGSSNAAEARAIWMNHLQQEYNHRGLSGQSGPPGGGLAGPAPTDRCLLPTGKVCRLETFRHGEPGSRNLDAPKQLHQCRVVEQRLSRDDQPIPGTIGPERDE